MSVITRLIPAPAVVHIGAGAAGNLAEIIADQRISASGRLAIVISEGSGALLRESLAGQLPADAGWFPVTDGTLDAAVGLADRIRAAKAPYDTLIGLGGGKVIDVTKYAAARVGLPMVAVATNLAHDGICSPVATLANDAGTGSYGVPGPIGIVVDLDLVRAAPPRFVRAGVGEALSNLSALADWELSRRETGEKVDGLAAALARTAGQAVLHQPGSVRDDSFVAVLAEALVLSGMAMSVAGTSRPSSGACHEICHAVNQLFPAKDAQHGELVGLGAAFATHLRGDPQATGALVEVLARHGLPYRHDHLGLDIEEFVQAVQYAPQTRPGRYTILEHLDLSENDIRDAVKDYANTYHR
ncbi:MAG TPA: iron-containing alcohol dehydrogenase family protein [Actinocrinis sp.]|nr:iron-containing alcohol dehydrogenase family protein [Actinocrinis sp.]